MIPKLAEKAITNDNQIKLKKYGKRNPTRIRSPKKKKNHSILKLLPSGGIPLYICCHKMLSLSRSLKLIHIIKLQLAIETF